MSKDVIELGQVVKSKAGRDKSRIFIVVAIINREYVLVADGVLRKIEKPKRKKIKHIELTKEILAHLKEKLYNNVGILNSEIQNSINNLEF